MIHLRFDWRRRIVYAVACLVFFLSSETIGNKKREIQNEITNKIINNMGSVNNTNGKTIIGNDLTVYLPRQ